MLKDILDEVKADFNKDNELVKFIEKTAFRISYIIENESKFMFLFINDLFDDINIIKKDLIEFKEKFNLQFEDYSPEKLNFEVCQRFDLDSKIFQRMMPPKIAIIGYQGVGKTSITELIRSKEIPLKKDPNITGDIATLKFASYHILLYDYSGPDNLMFLWKNFVKESNVIILVTNTTVDNIEKSKSLLNEIKKDNPHIIIIANQFADRGNLDTEKIENILGAETHILSALNTKCRYELIKLLLDHLGVDKDIFELLNKYNRRERIIKNLEDVLQQQNAEVAVFLFDQIIKISEELGEDPKKTELYKYREKIDELIKNENLEIRLTPPKGPMIEQKKGSEKMPLMEKNLKKLLKNYMDYVEGTIAVLICDREGLIITMESKREEEDDLLLGGIAVAVDSFIDRIKREFDNVSNFFNMTTIGDIKFSYCSIGKTAILTTVSDLKTSEIELRVYSEHIANKIELLLDGNSNVSLDIPYIIKMLAKTKQGMIPSGVYSSKLILVGDYSVGKTSLIVRFVKNTFKEDYHSTIAVDISQKSIQIADDTQMDFVIWDIGGQITQMAPYRKRFYERADSAFIVVDRTRLDSLHNVNMWYEELKKYATKNINIIIVGNKSDLVDEVVVSDENMKKVADNLGLTYILTSAKTGENVNDAFLYCAYNYMEKV